MTHFLGKVPIVLHHRLPVFREKGVISILQWMGRIKASVYVNILLGLHLVELVAMWWIKYRSVASTIKDIFMQMA